MTLVLAVVGTGITRTFTIQDADGNDITPGANDLVRVTIGRQGETAKLLITSGTPTANGSSLTAGATTTLRLDASDLNFDPGTYSMLTEYFDNADAAEWKPVSRQTFFLEGR
jgi:hypothetical protein